MNFTFAHNNLNVYDLEKSLDFYQKALNLKVEREKLADDESFKLVYLTDGVTPHLLELTWLRDMGCICFENPSMGIYFIEDPDGYWLEIVPGK